MEFIKMFDTSDVDFDKINDDTAFPISLYGHPSSVTLKEYSAMSSEARQEHVRKHAPRCCVCGGYLIKRETDRVRQYCMSCNSEYELRDDSWFITKMDMSPREDLHSIICMGSEGGFMSNFKKVIFGSEPK